jgi:hypothetical protein
LQSGEFEMKPIVYLARFEDEVKARPRVICLEEAAASGGRRLKVRVRGRWVPAEVVDVHHVTVVLRATPTALASVDPAEHTPVAPATPTASVAATRV